MPRNRRQSSPGEGQNTNTGDRKNNVRFQFDKYNPDEELWTYYRQRFMVELRINNITEEDTKRDLLLSKVGAEAFKILVDYASPNDVSTFTFDELLEVLNDYYKTSNCTIGERVSFTKCIRQENEQVSQYLNLLKAKAANCGFGDSLKERLRDQFIVGISNDSWQKELLRIHYNVDSTLEDVYKTALTLESVDKTQEHLTSQSNNFYSRPTNRVTQQNNRFTKRGSFRSLVLNKSIDCLNCGGKIHKNNESCPAKGKKCFACGIMNHFGKCCVKMKNAIIQKPTNYLYHKSSDTSETSSNHSYKSKINACNTVTQASRAMLSVKLNGIKTQMLYDPGASSSVISKELWEEIGSPELKQTPQLTAYTGVPIQCLGESKIRVKAFGKRLKLPVVVVEKSDVPLFGMSWVLGFDLPLPPGAQLCNVQTPETKTSNRIIEELTNEFKEVFSTDLGTMNGHFATIHLSENAQPKVFKPRPVPFALREGVEKEILRLVKENVLEPVDTNITPIKWASPIVIKLKSNNDIRICGDFKVTINPYVYIEPHPIPRFEEIVDKLRGGTQFSTLDLKDAYLQMPIHPSSQELLVISTHLGFFRYKRMVFGVASAAAAFQKAMDQILAGIPGVGWFLDDVIITGQNTEEHIDRLRIVLDRLKKAGIHLKQEKCKWLQDSVTYLGHRIDKTGIHPTETHIQAIKEMPDPVNTKQLRSFLGYINYYQKFVPNLQCISSPLHKLLQKGVRWHWTDSYKNIVEQLRNILCSSDTLVHFNPKYPIIVSSDASEYGLGAAISHRLPDGSERPVAFASRTLKSSEKHYSVIDREALGIIFAVKKFQQYLYGHHFILRTDHKPLVRLFGEHSEIPKVTSDRMTRWALFLSSFNYKIDYITSKENAIPDALSRLPLPEKDKTNDLEFGRQIFTLKTEHIYVTRQHLREETTKDGELKQVMNWMGTNWLEKPNSSDPVFKNYFNKRDELSYERGILCWKGRLVIPKTLQKHVLRILHEGHPGISAMKSFARLNVWWINIDKDIEDQVKRCKSCQENRPKSPDTTLISWSVPKDVWTRIHVDFAGPLEGHYWLVLVDATSKWIEVVPMKTSTTKKTISVLEDIFARFGYPRVIVSDNGPQFTSFQFKDYCKQLNMKHIRTFPYHPKSNGLAERTVRTFKSRYISSRQDKLDLESRLNRFLLSYRSSVHTTTDYTPAELMFGRTINTKLSLLKPHFENKVEEKLILQKKYADRGKQWREFEEGQMVWVLNNNGIGYSKGVVIKRLGKNSYLIRFVGSPIEHRRHADQLRDRLSSLEEGEDM